MDLENTKVSFPLNALTVEKYEFFFAKCPCAKNKSSDNEEDYNVKRKHNQHKNSHK